MLHITNHNQTSESSYSEKTLNFQGNLLSICCYSLLSCVAQTSVFSWPLHCFQGSGLVHVLTMSLGLFLCSGGPQRNTCKAWSYPLSCGDNAPVIPATACKLQLSLHVPCSHSTVPGGTGWILQGPR